MRSLLLSDLRLALPELLDDKAALLADTHTGRLYVPRLAERRAAIEALPAPAVFVGRPLAEELARTDAEHDGYGAAIWHYTEAMRLCPGVSDDTREAAMTVREAFIPELALLGTSYATEAAHALDKRERMPEHRLAFSLLPVPGKKTLRAWVDGFVSRGEALGALLRARAGHTAASASTGDRSRAVAATLRMETIAVLRRMRAALADELADDPPRLASLDAELFGYLDQLATDREASLRRRAERGPADADATPPRAAADDDDATPVIA